MARQAGSQQPGYKQAIRTENSDPTIEKFCNDELKTSLDVIKNAKNGNKTSPVQFGAAKTIVEMHSKYLKVRKANPPKPSDFIPKNDAEREGVSEKTSDEKDNILRMKAI